MRWPPRDRVNLDERSSQSWWLDWRRRNEEHQRRLLLAPPVTTTAAAQPSVTPVTTTSAPVRPESPIGAATRAKTPEPVASGGSSQATPGASSTLHSQSSRGSSAGGKRRSYASMSTGGVPPRDLAVRLAAHASLRPGLRAPSSKTPSYRLESLELSSGDESPDEEQEEERTSPQGKRSRKQHDSPEIKKKAASEAAKRAASRPRSPAVPRPAQRGESVGSEEHGHRRPEGRLGPMDLEYDTPERPDGSAGDTKFYAVVWDQIKEQYLYYRKRKDNVLFGGSADLKERCEAVDRYTDRLPDRKAHQLRAVVEVAIQCQFPSQAFIVGLDPRTSKRERQPTPEETAAYNWIRRIMAKEDAAWDQRAEKKLHAKLARLLTENIRWTAADLIHRCRKQIPELGSQLSIAEGFGDMRATIIAGPACGAGILMGVLEEIAETIGGEWDQSYDHVDLLPGSRAQLTRLSFALLTPSLDLFDMFLVALDPRNVHRRHSEPRPVPEPQPSDAAAELMRYLGPPENCRYDDLEFAAPPEWRAKFDKDSSLAVLRGAPGSFHRAFPYGRIPAWITFAGFAPGLEYDGEHEKTNGTVEAMLENLELEYRKFTRDQNAVLPNAPQSPTSPRVVNLRHSPFVYEELLTQPCIVLEQCTRRSEFACGPSRDDFSPEKIVVVAFSVYYQDARAETRRYSARHDAGRCRDIVLRLQRSCPGLRGPRNRRRRRSHRSRERAMAQRRGKPLDRRYATGAAQVPRERLHHRRMEPWTAVHGSRNRRAGVDSSGSGSRPLPT